MSRKAETTLKSYEEDILEQALFFENKVKVNPTFLNVRNTIIEYMETTSKEFDLHNQTFFISVSLLDLVIEKDYQLLLEKNYKFIGLIILWISSKFEEVYQLDLDELIIMLGYEYTKKDFIDFESKLLFTVQFQIPRFTMYSLLENYKIREPRLNNKSLFNKCLFHLKKKIYEIPKEKDSVICLKIIRNVLLKNKKFPL